MDDPAQDLPSAPSPLPLPMRRPSINAVHPFKSGTLVGGAGSPSFIGAGSGSPSFRSPLSAVAGGPSLPSRPVPSSPSSTRSPMSAAFRGPGSPVAPLRPSPPYALAPSSLGERRFPVAEGTSASSGSAEHGAGPGASPMSMPLRKRYSSSFGYRRGHAGGAGSDGSAGSNERERKDSERAGVGVRAAVIFKSSQRSLFITFVERVIPEHKHGRRRPVSLRAGHRCAEADRWRRERERGV